MKRNSLTVLVGTLLLVIFGLLLFTFQVRQTEIALVTTFDKPSPVHRRARFQVPMAAAHPEGLQIRQAHPNFEHDKIEETLTAKDKYPLVVQVYTGWTISKPGPVLQQLPSAEQWQQLNRPWKSLIRGAKLAVIGKHPFTDFVSTDKSQLKIPPGRTGDSPADPAFRAQELRHQRQIPRDQKARITRKCHPEGIRTNDRRSGRRKSTGSRREGRSSAA